MFTLKIDTRNAAFDEDPAFEITRILNVIIDDMECHASTAGSLYDINGNKVGEYKLTGKVKK